MTLLKGHARMIRGLPGSREAVEWLRETLEAMRAGPDPFDRYDDMLADHERRIKLLEERDDRPVDRETAAAGEPAEPDPVSMPSDSDPADHELVVDQPERQTISVTLDELKELLAVRVTAIAARRAGMTVSDYERVSWLANKPEGRTPDEDNELRQHEAWAAAARDVEVARAAKLAEIGALATIPAALAYDVDAGWPQ